MVYAALTVLETNEQRNDLAEFYKKNRGRLYRIAYSNVRSVRLKMSNRL